MNSAVQGTVHRSAATVVPAIRATASYWQTVIRVMVVLGPINRLASQAVPVLCRVRPTARIGACQAPRIGDELSESITMSELGGTDFGDSRYRRNQELLSVEMDGDLVMMSIETGNYFGVSGIGPFIWESIENPKTFNELVEDICAEFEVDSATAATDLRAFLDELVGHGMADVS